MRGLSFWRINVHDYKLTVTNDDLGNKTVVSFIRKSLIKQKSRTIYINDKRQLISLCMYYVHDTNYCIIFYSWLKTFIFQIIRDSQLSTNFSNREYSVLRNVMLLPD